MSASSTDALPRETSHRFSKLSLALLCVVAFGVIALAFYQSSSAKTAAQPDNTRNMKILGLSSPTSNRLNPAYTDANQDLIADAPTDPALQRDPDVLRFSFLSDEATGIDPARWQPVMDALAQATGKRVEYAHFDDPDDQLLALREGRLDVTALNTGNVPRAVNAAGFVPVAAPGCQGQPATTQSLLITRPGTGITDVEGVRGQLLALTRVGSNSGFKAPLVILLKDFDLQPERDFEIAFTRSHDQSIRDIAKGTYPVAAVASDMLDAAIASGRIDPRHIKVIYASAPFPRAAMGYAHDLQPDLAQQITDTLLGFQLTQTTVAEEFKGQDIDGFATLSYKDHFALVRLIDDAVGFQHTLAGTDNHTP